MAPVTSVARVRIPFLSLSGRVKTLPRIPNSLANVMRCSCCESGQPCRPSVVSSEKCTAYGSRPIERTLGVFVPFSLYKRSHIIPVYFSNLVFLPFGPTPARVPIACTAGWPSGLRRWFKAPVTSVARVRIPLLSPLMRHARG